MKLSSQKKTIIFVIIGFFLIFSLNFFKKEVREFFYFTSASLQKKLWSAGDSASDFWVSIFRLGSLRKDSEELNLKVQELFSIQNSLKELSKENKILREAMGLSLQKDFRLEIVNVISKDTNRDALLIDKGAKDGLSEGLPLITSQKVLIGKIYEVYQNYSRVLLISDKESSFEAKISGSNDSGLLKGLSSLGVMLDLIPKEAEVKEGSLVVSEDFLIGLVKKVKKIDVSPFQQAEISPFFNVSYMDKIFVALE